MNRQGPSVSGAEDEYFPLGISESMNEDTAGVRHGQAQAHASPEALQEYSSEPPPLPSPQSLPPLSPSFRSHCRAEMLQLPDCMSSA